MTKCTYRSQFEARTAEWFTARGIKFAYERDKLKYLQSVRSAVCKTCLSKDVRKRRVYLADFSFPGRTFFVETKGRFTSADRTKMLAVIDQGYDVRLVFMRNNRLAKKSTTTYAQWAELHGIRYSVGVPDPKWFAEIKKRVK